jgi:hypothetical protein
VAIQLLDWHTLEQALEFALEDFVDRGSHEDLKYGDGSQFLLNGVVTFLIHNFPHNFSLDTSLSDPKGYARLPAYQTDSEVSTPAFSAPVFPAPQAASNNGSSDSSITIGRVRRSDKLKSIRFGDLSMSDSKSNSTTSQPASRQQEPPRQQEPARQQDTPPQHAILTRILLNLPFSQLRMILESTGTGNINGWANAEVRYHIVREAVIEREARRQRALNAVMAGEVPHSELILKHLRSPEPFSSIGSWGALGWQEVILPYGNPNGPALGRKWVPLVESLNDTTAEYP